MSMLKFDTKTVKTVKIVVDPRLVLGAVIDAMIEKDPGVLDKEPGFLLIAQIIGYKRPEISDMANRTNGTALGRRLDKAKGYMEDKARWNDSVGQALGAFYNCAFVPLAHNQYTSVQEDVFGAGAKNEPLITTDGVVQFLRTAKDITFAIDAKGGTTTALEQIKDWVTKSGHTDGNTLAALVGITEVDGLTHAAVSEIVGKLRMEAADTELAPKVALDVARFMHTGDNGGIGTTGGAHKPATSQSLRA